MKRSLKPRPPEIFMIESILGCNLRCPACYIGSDIISRPKDILDFENFQIIAEKIRPYAKYVYLHIWGEPLLHPRIFDMIATVKKFAKVNISTHAQSLGREKAYRIINAGVDDLIVSLDGIEQGTYEVYRKGGRVQKVLEGIDHLIEAKAATGSPINIIVQFIVMRHNEDEIQVLREMFREKPVSLSLKAMYVQDYEQAMRFLPSLEEYRKYTIEGDQVILKADRTKCRDPFAVFTILVNGDVVQCCFDSSGEIVLGNILQSSVEDIWYGERAVALRRSFLERNLNRVCSSMQCGMGKDNEMVEGRPLRQVRRMARSLAVAVANRSPMTKMTKKVIGSLRTFVEGRQSM